MDIIAHVLKGLKTKYKTMQKSVVDELREKATDTGFPALDKMMKKIDDGYSVVFDAILEDIDTLQKMYALPEGVENDESGGYSREYLATLCRKAFVPHSKWANRDSSGAQMGVAHALNLLIAGCKFEVITEPKSKGDRCVTDEDTIWIQFKVRDFMWFETHHEDNIDGNETSDGHFYLPTEKRLAEREGRDWY